MPRKRVNIDAPTAMMKSDDVVSTVSSSDCCTAFQVSPPVTTARMTAPSAPTAPASVALKKPEKSPPKTSAISTRIGQMSRSALTELSRSSRMCRGIRSGRSQLIRRITET